MIKKIGKLDTYLFYNFSRNLQYVSISQMTYNTAISFYHRSDHRY